MAPKKTKVQTDGLPYTYRTVTEEIARFLSESPRGTQKRLAQAIPIPSQAFTHRMTEYRGERFSIEELAAIAKEAGLPHGWPFVSRDDAERFDALRKLVAKHNR